ncbi:hypothetical protein [Streptomyces yaizuensis]|uniref:Uncharacterized protein n=1 Tax=Streptomyces yaizuensis TaxID=2989713 RepID=A0ABQ5P657_9ACTN|nr:hypothetical protein [Streptomyces sp. YSPA8]GLF98070.1 hypothetical protein SYYSPA8_27255 [Streptomyces sp. YSPA8]
MTTSAPGTSDSISTPAEGRWTADRIRLWSFVCAALFAPAAGVAWFVDGFLSLMGEGGSRCLTYGEQCPASVPDILWRAPLAVAAIAFLAVLFLPERLRHADTLRRAAFAVQGLAEAGALLMITLPG